MALDANSSLTNGMLWQVVAGTDGGSNRARMRAVLDDHLELEYKTIRYHLDSLAEHGMVRNDDVDDGRLYLPSEQVRDRWDTIEAIIDRLHVTEPG